jgi:uncharacterized protein YrrD
MLKDINDIYGIQLVAKDGKIGQVEDFYFDEKCWIVRYLVVDSGPWYSGKRILISPSSVKSISDAKSEISVKHSRANIQRTLEDEIAKPAYASNELSTLLTS